MRIGIYGGSFDPIHYGHLILADRCCQQLCLDKVLFIPAATSPLKPHGPVATDTARVEMLELAIGGDSRFEISRCEIDRGGVSYTIDTVTDIQAKNPDAELFFLMGADLVTQLGDWKQPTDIFAIATPALFARGGIGKPEIDDLRAYLPVAETDPPILEMPQIELSSTELRERVRDGQSIRYCLPRAVEEYIRNEKLYGR